MQTIFRIQRRERGFTTIDNKILEDPRLSWKAKGLMAYLLGRPEDWRVMLADLVKRSTDGPTAVRSALMELKAAGYAKLERPRSDGGEFEGATWLISEVPTDMQETSMPVSTDVQVSHTRETPESGKPHATKKKDQTKKEGTKQEELPPLPLLLTTHEFAEAWGDWITYRKARRMPVTALIAKTQLAKLESMGHDAAIVSIRNSISSNWQGLFIPKPGEVAARTPGRSSNAPLEPAMP